MIELRNISLSIFNPSLSPASYFGVNHLVKAIINLKKIMKQSLYFAIIILLTIFTLSDANAHTLEKKIIESEVIIEGKVISEKCYYNYNKSRIVTCNIIEVFKVFKGESVQDTVCLITSGGRIIDLETGTVNSHGSAHPSAPLKGVEGIFFLKENDWFKLNEQDAPKDLKQYIGVSTIIKLTLFENAYSYHRYEAIERNGYGISTYYESLKELYKKIERNTGKPIENRKQNKIEVKNDKWLYDFSTSKSNEKSKTNNTKKDAIGIEMDIKRAYSSSHEYQYIAAKIKTPKGESIFLGNATFILEFNKETFGSNLVANKFVQVTKAKHIKNNAYTIKMTDVSAQKIKIEIFASKEPNIENLLILKELTSALICLKININLYTLSDTAIKFDDLSPEIKVQFYDPEKKEFLDFEPVVFVD